MIISVVETGQCAGLVNSIELLHYVQSTDAEMAFIFHCLFLDWLL